MQVLRSYWCDSASIPKPHDSMTPAELIAQSALPMNEARALLAHVCQQSRTWLIAHADEALTPTIAQVFQGLAQQRRQGVPMAYLLGTKEFYGRTFKVGPPVLIPRPETEILLEWSLNFIRSLSIAAQPTLLDLGTGSGVLAISLSLELPHARVFASDNSEDALVLAQLNAENLKVDQASLSFATGNWYEAWPRSPNGLADLRLIVSNPPYIAAQDPHLLQGDVRFEPIQALSDGQDGLSALRIIIAGASQYLAPGGALAVEHGYDQALAVRTLFEQAGFSQIEDIKDLAGINRVTCGHW